MRRRLSGLTRKKSSSSADAFVPLHPHAAVEGDAAEPTIVMHVPAPPVAGANKKTRKLVAPNIDERTTPAWWTQSDEMAGVVEALVREAVETTGLALERLAALVAADEAAVRAGAASVAETLCSEAAAHVSARVVLALEHAVASRGEPCATAATALALAWTPRDEVWAPQCFGCWSAQVELPEAPGIEAALEGIVEVLAAELVALCTSYDAMSPARANDALVDEILRLALDNTTSTTRTGLGAFDAVADACRRAASDQWAAAVGNVTPERGAAVLRAFCATTAHVLDARVLDLVRFVRLDLFDSTTRDALTETLDCLVPALDTYLTASPKDHQHESQRLRDEAAALACVSTVDKLLKAGNWEAVRVDEATKQLNATALSMLDAALAGLFVKIDDVWAPRKATTTSHPRLTRDMHHRLVELMITVVGRLPADVYGAQLEIFVSKRLQKPAMDKKDAPRALSNIATFLRGPRWRGHTRRDAAALSRFPRAPCEPRVDELDDATDGGEDDNDENWRKRASRTVVTARRLTAATRTLLARGQPRTVGGVRPTDNVFACCLPAFSAGSELFRPEVLVWIREKTFGVGGHYRCADLAANARLAADVILAMLANTMTTSFVRTLLDVNERPTGALSTRANVDRLERYVVGLRVVAVVLDDKSGFSKYAPTTRANAALPGGIDQVQIDVRGFFVAAAPNQLKLSLNAVSGESFATPNSNDDPAAGAPDCILDALDDEGGFESADGARHDARAWSIGATSMLAHAADAVSTQLAPAKMLHVQIIQETCRCAPFAPWTALGRGLLSSGLMHRAPCVRRSFRVALQRIVLDRPAERIVVVTDVFAHAAKCLADGSTTRGPVMRVAAQLLRLWHRTIRDGADGRSRADAAADADAVLELRGASKGDLVGWSARAEATALAFLADDDVTARDLALDVLEGVLAVRSSQLRLVDMVGRSAARGSGSSSEAPTVSADKARFTATEALTAKPKTIRELLLSDGLEEDVAQRAVRSFVDRASAAHGDRKSVSKPPLATSAPTLRKLSKMSNELWSGAIPLVAAATVSGLERGPALAGHTQSLLYTALTMRGAYKQSPDRFEAQLALLLALQCDTTTADALGKFLGEYAWPLLDEAAASEAAPAARAASPQQQQAAILGLLPKTTCSRLCGCCRAAAPAAAKPVVTSLLAWLLGAEQQKKAAAAKSARRAMVWALLRATVEGMQFEAAVATDKGLVAVLADAVASESFLDASPTLSQSVVDRTVLINVVASAIIERRLVATSHNDNQPVPRPPSLRRDYPRWESPDLLKLYKWLRETHIWPRPGGPLSSNYGVQPVKSPLASSHDDTPCTTQKGVPDADGYCLTIAGHAVAKLLTMGAFLPKATVDGLLDERAAPIDLTWFLTAEKIGPTTRCLRWLVAYHAESVSAAFIRRAVTAPRDGAPSFFHAVCDQLLPAASLPTPPSRSTSVEDSSRYFADVMRYGVDADLAQLALAGRHGQSHATPKRAPAVAFAAAFDDDRFVAGRPERLGVSSILLLGLRAMRDSDVTIRIRAFLLVRTVTLHVLSVTTEDVAAMRADFEELMSSYWVVFSSECTSRRDAEANTVLNAAAACVGAAGIDAVHDLLAEIFDHHARNRDEWGGAATTATIIGALCKHVVLAKDDDDATQSAAEGAASARGTVTLGWLVKFCAKNPDQSESLWGALCKGDRGAPRNVTAIVEHMRRTAAFASRRRLALTLAASQSATLAAHAVAPRLTTALLVDSLSFEAHERAVDVARGIVSVATPVDVAAGIPSQLPGKDEDQDDPLAEASGAVTLLSGLAGADPDSLLPHLATIVNFAVIHFASPTRFGGGAYSLSADFSERQRMPQLLHTLIINLQPRFLAAAAEEMKHGNSPPVAKVNALLALLRCGIDARFFELDWSRPIAALGDPTYLCDGHNAAELDSALAPTAWLDAVPSLDVAASGGGLAHPVALVRALADVLEIVAPSITAEWGRHALRWALESRDFPTRLKAYIVYLTLGAPRIKESLPNVVAAFADLHAELARAGDEAPTARHNDDDEVLGSRGIVVPTTGVASTAHYQAASCCCALLRVVGAALFEESAPPPDAVFWVADAALRTRCFDDVRARIYRYGVALFRAFVARTLSDDGATLGTVVERLRSAGAGAPTPNQRPPLVSSPLLDATASLASGLLTDDVAAHRDTRLAVAPILVRVAPATAPSKKESRTVFACLFAALAPWLASRAGSFDAVEAASALADAAEGAGDGGYLGSALCENLVVAAPPNVQGFTQRCAAWLASAAAGAADTERVLRRIDAALAAAADPTRTAALVAPSSPTAARAGATPRTGAPSRRARDAPTRAAALSLAAELLMRDDGGFEAAHARAAALGRVAVTALTIFAKTASPEKTTSKQRRVFPTAGPLGGGRSGAANLVSDDDNDRIDGDERVAASAVVALVVERVGIDNTLLADDGADGAADDGVLGWDDGVVSDRLRFVSRLISGGAQTAAAAPPTPRQEEPQPTPEPSARLRDDPRWAPYAPYVQLVARGVPLGAVRLRAVGEGLDPNVLQCDPDAPAPPGLFDEDRHESSHDTRVPLPCRYSTKSVS